jgi:hypothetical protein
MEESSEALRRVRGNLGDDRRRSAMPRKATEAAATTKSAAKRIGTRRTKKTQEAEPIVLEWGHIAERAYYIHLIEGGEADENWLRAERELVTA